MSARVQTLAEQLQQRVCEGCDVRMPAGWCEQADDGVWLCCECADAEHAEQERAEGAGEAMGIHEQEGWAR